MTNSPIRLFPLVAEPGIKRDGTEFEGNNYVDGAHTRFYRGLPYSMGGYRSMSDSLDAIVRGQLLVNSNNGYNTLYAGNANYLNSLTFDDGGSGGVLSTARTPAAFVTSADNIWQMSSMDYNPGGYQALVAHAAPNMDMYSSTTAQVYWGDINASTALVKLTDTGTGALGDLKVSGGVLGLYPYLFYYGNSGKVGWSIPGDLTNISGTGSGNVRISGQKVVLGAADRASGTNQPAAVFWALDKFVRANFVGGTAVFSFSSVPGYGGLLSTSAVVEYDGFYYWPANGKFQVYTGVIKELKNDKSLMYFYDNYNKAYRQKIWGVKNEKWGEIWWFFPKGTATECNHALIYNVRENTWYDTPMDRSAGIYDTMFPYPIMCGNQYYGTATGYTIWQHEYGNDVEFGGNLFAIEKYIESCEYGMSNNNPNGIPGGMDNFLQFDRVELDFIQTGDLTLTLRKKTFPRSPFVDRDFVFTPSDSVIRTQFQGRSVRYRITSNVQGGSFAFGRTLTAIDTESGDMNP